MPISPQKVREKSYEKINEVIAEIDKCLEHQHFSKRTNGSVQIRMSNNLMLLDDEIAYIRSQFLEAGWGNVMISLGDITLYFPNEE